MAYRDQARFAPRSNGSASATDMPFDADARSTRGANARTPHKAPMSLARLAAEAAFAAPAPTVADPGAQSTDAPSRIRVMTAAAHSEPVAGSADAAAPRAARVFRLAPASGLPGGAEAAPAPPADAAGDASPRRAQKKRKVDHLPTPGRVIYALPTVDSATAASHDATGAGRFGRLKSSQAVADVDADADAGADAGAGILAGLDAVLKQSTLDVHRAICARLAALEQQIAALAPQRFR